MTAPSTEDQNWWQRRSKLAKGSIIAISGLLGLSIIGGIFGEDDASDATEQTTTSVTTTSAAPTSTTTEPAPTTTTAPDPTTAEPKPDEDRNDPPVQPDSADTIGNEYPQPAPADNIIDNAPEAVAPPAPAPADPAPAPAPVDPPSVGTVHPGSFCTGGTGVSATGKPMVCAPASDGRLRWQSA